ncbi:uncharacterized protein K452DRAFT_290292 [Aplosporella prunicola CBS 121167]|uniref:Uncharacterized protein n=1 Tax=Aplosporella prunicola CBS 121167 TaxID=1176127 RepID=A0A6A6B7H3_9PEZI|nr:uncharacterized protein K452DRAFT_290292 [Aplosporella prunicola CBS 121167]KAF2139195.1 hypothetical protein K452DRAFT_290292 [Aplosporella prunicola CBS 121167]
MDLADAILQPVDAALNWLVIERVLAEWNDPATSDRRYLGTLSSVNGAANFTLAIGYGATTRQLFISLHLPIKLRASTSSKLKHMYYVVPVEALGSKGSQPALFVDVSRTEDVPEQTLPELRKAGLVENGSKRIIRIGFRLKERGYVIMPQGSLSRPPQGTPLRLLQNLRSLSEQAAAFDLYLKYNDYDYVELCRVCENVSKIHLTTPALDVKSLFKGLGAVNVWEQYAMPSETRDKYPTKLHFADRETSPPPQYDRVTPSPSPLVLVPASSLGSSPKQPSVDRPQHGLSVIPETPEAYMPASAQASRKRKATSPLSGGFKAHDHDDQLEDAHSSQQDLYGMSSAPSVGITAGQASPCETPSQRLLQQHENAQPDTVTQNDVDPALFADMVQWLEWAWSALPSAHLHLQAELLALGAAVCNVNAEAFADQRAVCMAKLLFLVTDANRVTGETEDEHPPDFELEVRDVVRWMNQIYRAADIVIARDLMQLAEVAQGAAANDEQRRKAFRTQKAVCVARVCMCFGKAG